MPIFRHPIILPLLLMLFLALLTFWINQTVQEQTKQHIALKRHDPDYMLYNFVSTRTDAAGQTRYVLAATQMRHFPDRNIIELVRPRFTQFGLQKPYTQIQGRRGWVTENGKQVEFRQQVKVVRQASGDKGEMILNTEQLILEPEKAIAHTSAPVTITQTPATVITATGMHFDKNAQTIQLFNRVHVHYERARMATTHPVSPPSVHTRTSRSKLQ